MRLVQVVIKNFRSIRDVSIETEPTCRVLVGVNESGKSNILKAFALLDPSRPITNDDIRDFHPTEDDSAEAVVRFVFRFAVADHKAVYQQARLRILTSGRDAPIVVMGSNPVSLRQLCEAQAGGVFEVDLRKQKRLARFRPLNVTDILPGWFKPSATCPPGVTVVRPDRTSVALNTMALVDASSVDGIDVQHLVPAEVQDVVALVGGEICARVRKTLPTCLYWSYSDAHLLPSQIVLEQFANDPSSCEPLEQMFLLAGIADVRQAVTDAAARRNGMRNLLDKIAKTTTKHLHQVWHESKGLQIDLVQNGTHVNAAVKDGVVPLAVES